MKKKSNRGLIAAIGVLSIILLGVLIAGYFFMNGETSDNGSILVPILSGDSMRPSPVPVPESTPTPIPTPSPSPTPTPSPSPSPSPTPTPTPTPTPSPTPIPNSYYEEQGDKIIYLTFDDGPSNYTEQLLDVLDKYDVKATFFVVNTGRSDLIAEEYARGHSIGVHSYTHDYAIYKSKEAYFEDFNKMQDVIEAATGQRSNICRFPGGSSNTVSKKYCKGIITQLAAALEEEGYAYFDWNVSSGDAGAKAISTQKVYENVIAGISSRNVSVVLQHDIKKFSVEAVEDIIKWGLENGYKFLPLDNTSYGAHHTISN